jgi:hypothetical protein
MILSHRRPPGVALLAIFALGGCAAIEPIKAYEGPERPGAELAILESAFERDWVTVADVQIAAVDGVGYPGPKYRAGMLPGQHRVIVKHTSVVGSQKQEQFCAFEFDMARGCTYRPYPPSYPSPALLRGAESEWRLNVALQVSVSCPDLSADIRVPADCAGSRAALAQRRPSYQMEH